MCSACDAQNPSPSDGVIPTTCSCGKYPWSEVAVLTTGKNAPDQPGSGNGGNKEMLIRPIMPLAGKKKKHDIPPEYTDCGVEECKTDEFKMMKNPKSDKKREDFWKDILNSSDFLAIDG
jgi:hypothetical protein